jgi:pilus assembly protein CpaC
MVSMVRTILAVVGAGLAITAMAAPPKRSTVNAVYQVPLYKSTIVPMDRSPTRVSVGNPGVADILVIRNRELYVVGKALGSTNVVVWDDSGRAYNNFDIEVTHDLDTLKAKLYELMPGEDISVQSAQEQLILSGQVTTAARASAAMSLAGGFLPDCIAAASDAPGASAKGGRADASCKKGGVLNLMQVGGAQQVMLKVTISEMAHSVVKRLEGHLNFMKFGFNSGSMAGGGVSGGASFPVVIPAGGGSNAFLPVFDGTPGSLLNPIGPPVTGFFPSVPTIDDTGLFLSYLNGNEFISAVLDISKRNGLAKILSEPTLTTLTGQEATFLSGGELPIPVPQGGVSGGVTIDFKEFGVGLKFTPVVLDSGRINLALNVSVSEISGDNAVVIGSAGTTSTFAVPSLTKRSAASTIELGDGQTMGIAGLINDTTREFVQKFPFLGDLPIIGALFRSQEYRSGQSELVIFVTPHLARPIAREHFRMPTDTFVPPGDIAFYLLGHMGRQKDRPPPPAGGWANPAMPARKQDMPKGSYGHDLGKPPAAQEQQEKQP